MLSHDYPTYRTTVIELETAAPSAGRPVSRLGKGLKRLAGRLWNGYVEHAGRHVYYNEQGYACGWLYWY